MPCCAFYVLGLNIAVIPRIQSLDGLSEYLTPEFFRYGLLSRGADSFGVKKNIFGSKQF
jgi:hypothetical protein